MNVRSVLFLGAAEDSGGLAARDRIAAVVPDVTTFMGTWADARTFPAAAREWRGDMILSHRSRWIVPADVLGNARAAAVNIHPGTPEYPGIGAANFALYEGAVTFGATLHHMAPQVDTGPIIKVRRFPVTQDETLESIARETYIAVDYLLGWLIAQIIAGTPLLESRERWTRRPFRRTELDALQRCDASMSTDELAGRWHANYMAGLPDKYLARIGTVRVDDWLATGCGRVNQSLSNVDPATADGFGAEWKTFTQACVPGDELRRSFDLYFRIFPLETLTLDAEGFDAGCGSGRWSRFVAPRVKRLHCVDASPEALDVARENLADFGNCTFSHASISDLPVADASMDFGYCLGVLHHVPDPAAGLKSCAQKLKPGAPLLVYLYYAFDNSPAWFRALWHLSDWMRRIISKLPHSAKVPLTTAIALGVYWPIARTAAVIEKLGVDVSQFPLMSYRHAGSYTMRTDALDRFGTRLEQRFTRSQVDDMMKAAGLENIRFSEVAPFWCAIGYRA